MVELIKSLWKNEISFVKKRNFWPRKKKFSRSVNPNGQLFTKLIFYVISYFERPWLKKTRQLYAGQYDEVFQTANTPKEYLKAYIEKTIG